MRVNETVCDVEGCSSRKAVQSSIYKESKLDGAGSSEKWFYVFDLCTTHQTQLLNDFCDAIGETDELSLSSALDIIKDLGIKTRVG